MTTQRIEDVFSDALTWPPEERETLLSEACGDDKKLRVEVESLLAAHAHAGPFMAEPSVEPAPTVPLGEGPGTTVGRYSLLQLIGEGGFGAVFMAQQREPVRRTVALKIIKLGMDTKQVIARFEAERQALAMMDHPSIARVFDAGATEAGRPYFVMEIVRGEPITQFCDHQNLSIPQRLELFQQVCQAVQHAHQKGIIHRDLKPSNILVGEIDGRPMPKIIDFGIAKATGGTGPVLTDKTLVTDFRQFIGTPEYMSPEQVGMGAVDIDTRSDIYSLGVLLYELLTGGPPFDPKHLRSAAWEEMRRIIREDDPERPSTRLNTRQNTSEVATCRGAEPSRLIGLLRGDLDWIVMKCLDKDRARRYESANALAMDIERHTAGEPVVAAPPSRVYKAQKFVRRNRSGVLVASVVAAALLLGVIGTSIGLVRANKAEDLSQQRATDLEQVVDFQQAQLAELDAMVMGEGLRDAILTRRRAKLELDGVDAIDIQHELDALKLAFESVNFTNVAIDSLYENIFEPALREIDERFGEQPLVQAQLLRSVASALRNLGMPELAQAPLEEALEICRRVLTDADRFTIEVVIETSALYQALGRLDESERLARLAVKDARRALGGEDRTTVHATQRLGVILNSRGKFVESEQCHREVVQIGKRVFGEKHPTVLGAASDVAIQLKAQGKSAEAETLFREVLQLREEVQGHDHAGTLKTAYALAVTLRAQGKLEEAELYLRRAMEGFQRALGEEHIRTLGAKNEMIRVLLGMSKLDGDVSKLEEADRIGTDAIRTSRQFMTNRMTPAESLFLNHARILIALERFEQAEDELNEVKDMTEDPSISSHSPNTSDTNWRMAARIAEVFVELYSAWHAAEPDAGHDIKAAQWQTRLSDAEAQIESSADSDG